MLMWIAMQLLAAVLVASAGQASPPPRVVNGSFEDWAAGPVGWKLEGIHPDPPYEEDRFAKGEPRAEVSEQAHGAGRSLHVTWPMTDKESDTSAWTLTSEPVEMAPGQTYTVSAWMKGSGGFRCGVVHLSVIALSDQGDRGLGRDMVVARSDWQQFLVTVTPPEGCRQIRVRFEGRFNTDLFLDEVQVELGERPWIRPDKPQVSGYASQRRQEKLDRGLVALAMPGEKTYLGWRLVESDPGEVAFNVYRRAGDAAVRLNAQPVAQTTDFVDESPPRGNSTYFVRPV